MVCFANLQISATLWDQGWLKEALLSFEVRLIECPIIDIGQIATYRNLLRKNFDLKLAGRVPRLGSDQWAK